jgi:hypothetical protein
MRAEKNALILPSPSGGGGPRQRWRRCTKAYHYLHGRKFGDYLIRALWAHLLLKEKAYFVHCKIRNKIYAKWTVDSWICASYNYV